MNISAFWKSLFKGKESLYIYTANTYENSSFSASYHSIRQPEIIGLGRLERRFGRGCVLRAQNMDRQFDDDLGMFVNYSV